MTRWIEKVTGSLEDKRRWRAYNTRKAALPVGYRTAIDGIERYLMRSAAIVKSDVLVQMLEDLIELVEASAADGTPIRDVVGDDPVEFADAFAANYRDSHWIDRERTRLAAAMDEAVQQQGANGEGGAGDER